MNLTDWLLHIQASHPATIQLGLERINAIAKPLKLCNFPIPIITVAGTNGKGSCVALLESVLLSTGKRVATYTSPHLMRFNERLKIDGIPASDNMLIEAFQYIQQYQKALQTELTFFEFTSLAILYIIRQLPLDIAVLEIGLGGRLDAVNIVNPDIAIITPIDLDHIDYLGHDRATIGQEKAGIIRPNKPVICGDRALPHTVVQQANRLNSPLYQLGKDFDYELSLAHNTWKWYTQNASYYHLPTPHLPEISSACALMATECLKDHHSMNIHEHNLHEGISNAHLPGRFQLTIKDNITTIVDVGHNPSSARWLAQRINTLSLPQHGSIYCVLGIAKDKQIIDILSTLHPLVDQWFFVSLPKPRGASSTHLSYLLDRSNLPKKPTHLNQHPTAGYKKALSQCLPGDTILVFGSFHTAAQILSIL